LKKLFILKNKTKLKAFTLSEMLVVLAITAIVVSLAFVILNLVTKQIQLISTNYINDTEVDKLENALWIDLNAYETVIYNEQNRILYFSNSNKRITYVFSDNYSLRNQDTLIQVDGLNTYFLGAEHNTGIIDAIELSIGDEKIFVSKITDASFYLNN
tara:strand:+ start:14171 stop:14641 length:471 start_codon:yes stop_codon:yes gene_type:complete